MMKSTRSKRYSISVSGMIYDRLRTAVTGESTAAFVEDVIASALDDPETSDRIVARCLREARA